MASHAPPAGLFAALACCPLRVSPGARPICPAARPPGARVVVLYPLLDARRVAGDCRGRLRAYRVKEFPAYRVRKLPSRPRVPCVKTPWRKAWRPGSHRFPPPLTSRVSRDCALPATPSAVPFAFRPSPPTEAVSSPTRTPSTSPIPQASSSPWQSLSVSPSANLVKQIGDARSPSADRPRESLVAARLCGVLEFCYWPLVAIKRDISGHHTSPSCACGSLPCLAMSPRSL